MPSNSQKQIQELQKIWQKNPLLGIKQLFQVEPTEQQKGLILDAWHPQARSACASCQGAGKTATLVWLTFLFLLTQPDCRVLITSPSYQQLTRVFHAEACKWHAKMPEDFKDFFEITKENIKIKSRPHIFASLVTASAENEESLQGGHSESYVVLADEASGIDEKVFDLLLGTLSTGKGGRFVMTSNPLRSAGRFAECFSKESMQKEHGGKWTTMHFSAYDSPNINKDWIEEMKSTYGEDSDIFRVRVLGQFPRASNSQFFPTDLISSAIKNRVDEMYFGRFPRISGADIARFGDDSTVFVTRQGPKLLDITEYRGLDTMEVAGKLVEYRNLQRAQVVAIDAIGIGAGVYDRCRQLGLPTIPVVVSNKSTEPQQYLNLRSQLYGHTKQWLENGAQLPMNEDMRQQFLSMQYGYNPKMQVQLMAKKDIKKLGLPSPDIVDAIALTFVQECLNTQGSFNQKPRRIIAPQVLWA